ncbi:ABC transporter ATP-binding protein [Reinekea blandensis]|uniref:Hypothetical NosF protein n=1 Tax=Reinekea blandensis MED297 TaxID=314283 RepID=A4BIK4_9GAMM|nr:ABC transporter ATP-binding protein [Reinekea blandensis]EAR08083.1 hypothetical NosF protein [Reinekea sp. MED297] [Reinekea blandensis MED297]
MNDQVLIELSQVGKHYDHTEVLQAVDLTLHPGEMLALMGHNGAGKTTLIKLILGLIQADVGQLSVLGCAPGLRNQQIGYVPENVSFYPMLTGRETLEYFARLNGLSRKAARQRSTALLDRVGLSPSADRRVKHYSKGMKQRLGLAQALLPSVHRGGSETAPSLLILDEPTVGLDPIATLDFFRLLAELREQGCGVIICTHVLPGLEPYLDSALILNRGRAVAQGRIDDLFVQADLPVSMAARGLNGSLRSDRVLQQYAQTDDRLVFPASQKLAVLQAALAYPALADIQVVSPGLPELYQHFLTQAETVQ